MTSPTPQQRHHALSWPMRIFSSRLFHAFAIGCILAVVYSSTAWQTIHLAPALIPPYSEPPIAQHLPNDTDIQKLLGDNMLLTANRPPNASIYTSNDVFFAGTEVENGRLGLATKMGGSFCPARSYYNSRTTQDSEHGTICRGLPDRKTRPK